MAGRTAKHGRREAPYGSAHLLPLEFAYESLNDTYSKENVRVKKAAAG